MPGLPLINLVAMVHLIFLCLWGGVVATESVLELYPRWRREFHPQCIEYHYWIDLLVELPLIALVILSGTALVALAWPISLIHLLKLSCAAVAIGANLVCVFLVVRRYRLLKTSAAEDRLWRSSRRIVLCAVVGLPFAAAAAGIGFWLSYQRLLLLIGG